MILFWSAPSVPQKCKLTRRARAAPIAARWAAWSLASAFALGSSFALAADAPGAEEGKRAFKAGVLLLQDPDGAKYDEALIEFRRAHKVLGTWKVLGNIGLCTLKLERDGEAIEAYEKYLAGGGAEIDKDERAQVEQDLLRLRTQLVKVRFEPPAPGAQVSDERTTSTGSRVVNLYTLPPTGGELGLHPGHHVFVVKLGDKQARAEAELVPASSVAQRIDFGGAPAASGPSAGVVSAGIDVGGPPSKGSNLRTIGFVVGGAGVVGLGLGAMFAVQRGNAVSESETLCNGPGGACPTSKQSEIDGLDDDARRSGALSVASFAVGGAALAAGVALIVVGGKSNAPITGTAPRVLPWVGAGSAGLAGTF